jgi:hypothetical protein
MEHTTKLRENVVEIEEIIITLEKNPDKNKVMLGFLNQTIV